MAALTPNALFLAATEKCQIIHNLRFCCEGNAAGATQKGLKSHLSSPPNLLHICYLHKKQIRIQTSRDRDFGRATTENGAVYRYESLQKGQTFMAHILCDRREDADILRPFLNQTMHIGGVRSSEFLGRVQLQLVEKGEEDETWSETDNIFFETGELPDTTAIITLLSDALLRNDRSIHMRPAGNG